jgi:fructose/tagatose bisphosphate aldolase
MAVLNTLADLKAALGGAATVGADGITITDAAKFRGTVIDDLVETATFAEDADTRNAARWVIRAAAPKLGVVTSSIHDLYMAVGKGQAGGFCVPAINIRGLTYDVSRTICETIMKMDGGPFIFEIARSEIGYTHQRPAEYAAAVTAGAIKSGYEGPIFIQGDHFQANAKKYAADPAAETQALRDLILEAIEADFRNIDIDTSTLVDLSHETLDEQQRVNYERGAELTAFIREHEPEGVTVSVGGEIGEVGKDNSTVPELQAYLDGYNRTLKGYNENYAGVSKVSVQTGTTHGGVPMADGTVANVAVDFETLQALSECSINEYGIGGAVQHGASTLPEDFFDKFPATKTVEIHLATGFQNIAMDHPSFPEDLKAEIYTYLRENLGNERKEGWTDEQFIYKTRKKAWGPFKQQIWNIGDEARAAISAALAEKFSQLFTLLGVPGSRGAVNDHVTLVPPVVPPVPAGLA